MSDRADVDRIRKKWREGAIFNSVVVDALLEILDALIDIKYAIEAKR